MNTNDQVFIHSFKRYLLSTYYVSDAEQGPGCEVVSQMKPCSPGAHILMTKAGRAYLNLSCQVVVSAEQKCSRERGEAVMEVALLE